MQEADRKNTIHRYGRRIRTLALGGTTLAVLMWSSERAKAQEVNLSPIASYAQELAAKGIIFNANYFAQFSANPSGGAKQGTAYADQITGGADIDLNKLIGLPGGSLHVEFSNRDGQSLAAEDINNSVTTQATFGGGQTYHLITLLYDQKLFNGVLDLQGGRTELSRVAIFDPIYCRFQSNMDCATPPLEIKDLNVTSSQIPVWGGSARVAPTKNTYILGAAYDFSKEEAEAPHHGFDFSLADSQGVQFVTEVGYQTSFTDSAYPSRYDIGAIFDRTPYTFVDGFNVAKKSLENASGYGRSLVYFQAKQVVYRPDKKSPRGLTLFGVVAIAPNETQPIDFNVNVGAVYQGPFSRPADSFGISIGDSHYRKNFLTALYDERVHVLGGTDFPRSNLIMAEVDYDAFLTRWLDVMPNFQYIVNPDGLGFTTFSKNNLPDAFVAGLQFNVNIATLIGLRG